MKSINLKFKIAAPRKATVKATALMNAVNINILMHNGNNIDRTKLRGIIRELTGNPVNGYVNNRFIAIVHNTPKYVKINVTLLLRNAETKKETKQRIKETTMDVILKL